MKTVFRSRAANRAYNDAAVDLCVLILRLASLALAALFSLNRNSPYVWKAAALGLALYLCLYCIWLYLSRNRRWRLFNLLLFPVDVLLISMFVKAGGGLESQNFLLYFMVIIMQSPYGGLASAVVAAAGCVLGYLFAVGWGLAGEAWLVFWLRASYLFLLGLGCGFLGERSKLLLQRVNSEKEESLRRLSATATLVDVNRNLLAQFDLRGALLVVLGEGAKLLQAAGGLILLDTEDGWQVAEASGIADKLRGYSPLSVGGWLHELARSQAGVVTLIDGSSLSASYRDSSLSCVSATLNIKEEHKGVVAFLREADAEDSGFTPQELSYVENLAASLALAISRIELYAQIGRRNSHLLLLNEISRSLAANLDMEELFETMYREVARVMSADAFFVALYDGREEVVDVRYLYDNGQRYPALKMPLNDGPTSRAIKTGKPLIFNADLKNIPGVRFIGDDGSQNHTLSLIVVPMRQGQRITGAISVQSYRPNAYTDEHLQLLETVAAQAGVVLTNVRLYARSLELSYTDSMTGLANARRLYQELEKTLQKAAENHSSVSLLMVDSDSLKQINDRYGHPAGDQHIMKLAQIIRSQIRTHDLAARYAGDEFIVILPDTSREQALLVAERIRSGVSVHYMGQQAEQIRATVSIGVATFPEDATTPDALFKAADRAMYAAKEGGRNRVSRHEP